MIDELELLRGMRAAVAPPEEDARGAAADALLRAIAQERRAAVARLRPTRRARRRRSWAGRAALAGGLCAVAVGAGALLRGGPPAGPAPAAAAAVVLRHLALVASTQPAPDAPAPGQFLYVHSQAAYMSYYGHYAVLVPQDRQFWVGPDGSGRIDETFGQPSFLSASDQAAWVAAGSPAIDTSPSDTFFAAGCLSDGPTDLATLPTDPAALAAMISSRQIEGGPPGPAEDFVQVADLLRETDATPALRAALYQVAAGIPGVQSLGTVTDHAGRQGVGLAFDSAGQRSVMIFDPTTAALLGEETIILDSSSGSDAAPGTVAGWAVYLDSTVVDSDAQPADPSADHVVPMTPPPSGATGPSGVPLPVSGDQGVACHDVGQ